MVFRPLVHQVIPPVTTFKRRATMMRSQGDVSWLRRSGNESVWTPEVNNTDFDCPFSSYWGTQAEVCIIEASVLALLTALIVLGNVTVMCVFHCAPLLHHHTTSYFIRTMAYADLAVGLSCALPTLWLLRPKSRPTSLSEPIACQTFAFVVSVLKSVSVACLACIGLDRYVAITRPLSYARLVTPCRVRLCVALIWTYSCTVFAPSFLGWGKPGYHGDMFRWCGHGWRTNALYTAFLVCSLYAPAACVVCFTYSRIFCICRQHAREIRRRHARFPRARGGTEGTSGSGPLTSPDCVSGGPGAERRYVSVLFRITSVFYALWLPYVAYLVLESARVAYSAPVSFLATWLAMANSFCNCLVYSLSTSSFRLGLRRLSGAACAACGRRDRRGWSVGKLRSGEQLEGRM
uniref:G-protein coupled receptor 52-like n=1 Tax=Myxine glutinosa TaxID=7769 RepID=UPI00358DF8D3